jgi:hypothetical protein
MSSTSAPINDLRKSATVGTVGSSLTSIILLSRPSYLAPSGLANVACGRLLPDSPFADPDVAARKLVELANAVEPVQDGRIYIEKINGPFLYQLKGTPAEYQGRA